MIIKSSISNVDPLITGMKKVIMGNFLWTIIETSPKFTGWAIPSFAWAFLVQVFYLTITGLLRYHDLGTVDTPKWYDYVWFIYRELPSMLPMITVFSVSITVVMLISGIFIRTGYTVGELPGLMRTHPWAFIVDVVLPLLGLVTLVVGLFLQEWTVVAISLVVLSGFFSHKMVNIMITWTRVYLEFAS